MPIRSIVSRYAAVAALASLLATSCLPYTVGSTARTAPRGTFERTAIIYAIPGAVESDADSISIPQYGVDGEVRYGIDDHSDFGLRIPSMSGAVLNYKRRLGESRSGDGPAFAVSAGGGFVNFGEHALGEVTFVTSGPDRGTWTPYGGLRAMHVIPLSRYAVSDRPTVGGFLGIRFGTADVGVSPEIGIYHDPSALGFRRRRVVLVPAISIHGEKLLSALGGAMGRPW